MIIPLRPSNKIVFLAASLLLLLLILLAFPNILNPPDGPAGYRIAPSSVTAHFLAHPDEERQDYHEWNGIVLRDLTACLAARNCGTNQMKVVIGGANWWQEGIVTGWRGGEGVWAVSMFNSLKSLGYSVLMARGKDEIRRMYNQFPDLVKVIIKDYLHEVDDHEDFVKNPKNPQGIPIWKLFDMSFFPGRGAGIMQGPWTLNAENHHADTQREGFHYIGYTIEEDCMAVDVVPFSEKKDRAWLFTKQLTYAYRPDFAWNRTTFSNLTTSLPGLEIRGAFQVDETYAWNVAVDGHFDDVPGGLEGVNNLGRIGPERFAEELSTSKVLLGIGQPIYSPSPWVALCLGVPFINPIVRWDHNNPDDRRAWVTQHGALTSWEPPQVYHVKHGDYEGLKNAVRDAMKAEIPRTVPIYMKRKAHEERMRDLVETDWKTLAEVELAKRIADPDNKKRLFHI